MKICTYLCMYRSQDLLRPSEHFQPVECMHDAAVVQTVQVLNLCSPYTVSIPESAGGPRWQFQQINNRVVYGRAALQWRIFPVPRSWSALKGGLAG